MCYFGIVSQRPDQLLGDVLKDILTKDRPKYWAKVYTLSIIILADRVADMLLLDVRLLRTLGSMFGVQEKIFLLLLLLKILLVE